ncbi:MAG: endonuclease, partial [Nocardioidaceae bacterium]|nr:endonuclease [Nocardioidaceae bacterium]
DLNQHLRVDAYEIPDRLHDQVKERDGSCVFPWCARTARSCDTDHVVPYDEGGPTSSDNLAALCRSHHRLKTHGSWTYTVLEPGSYLWRSPNGLSYLRDGTGTQDVSRPPPADQV